MATANPSEQLQQLISERQRYEAWLNSLNARREVAPAHVVERIEEDYRKRLNKIGEELSARAGELRERASGLATRLAEIKLQESARRDEKAEAEIRTAVGEYSPGQWAEISERVDGELSVLEADGQVVQRDLSELERVLQQVLGDTPSAAGAAAPADATRTSGQQARPAPRPAPVPHKIEPPPDKRSAAEEGSTSGKAAAPAEAKRSATTAPHPTEARTAPAAAPPSQVSRSGAPRQSADPAAQKRTDASQRQGQEKTLLCNECGTANYPTEWYCEACGAELATL